MVCPLCKNPTPASTNGVAANKQPATLPAATTSVTRLCAACCSMIALLRPKSSLPAPAGRFSSAALASSNLREVDLSQAATAAPVTAASAVFIASEEAYLTPLEEGLAAEYPSVSAASSELEPALEYDTPFRPAEALIWHEDFETTPAPAPAEETLAEDHPPLANDVTNEAFPAVADNVAWSAEADLQAADGEVKKLDGTEINDVPASWDATDDYSVLLAKEEKPLGKRLLPLAAVLLVVVLVAAYFLIFQPLFASRGEENALASEAASSPVPTSAAAVTEPAQSSQAPATPAASPAPAPPTDNPNLADVTAGQGKFALQAASFPNADGAEEFSKRLIRAGVPAYVVTANLAGKGTWYRVRIGRFLTSTEAEAYAEQAKQRSKAAGVNLQLVVCDFAK